MGVEIWTTDGECGDIFCMTVETAKGYCLTAAQGAGENESEKIGDGIGMKTTEMFRTQSTRENLGSGTYWTKLCQDFFPAYPIGERLKGSQFLKPDTPGYH